MKAIEVVPPSVLPRDSSTNHEASNTTSKPRCCTKKSREACTVEVVTRG